MMMSNQSLDMLKATIILLKDLGFSRGSQWYIRKRVACEGLHFLTHTLPALSKHVLRCIELGQWSPFAYEGNSPLKTKGRERYTYFIYDELSTIFGSKVNQDSALNLWRIRQICEYCYKLALPFSDGQLDEAARKFLDTESSISFDPAFAEKVRVVAENHFTSAKKLTVSDCMSAARFGPGTFSHYQKYAGVTLQDKKDFLNGMYPTRMEAYKGYYRARTTSILTGKRQVLKGYKPLYETSEVLFVPKDSRGPRTIVREPAHNIYAQMGFFSKFSSALQRDTYGRIQFISQEEFREHARQSSITRRFATLDLKEASDRISVQLARTVYRNFPAFSGMEALCRTAETVHCDGSIIALRKLAGMGSGFTFACMAGIIFSSIVASAPKHLRRGLAREVYVYGDDIIVPTWAVDFAKTGLVIAGLQVNADKSYFRSHFRESCGGDFFHGENVAPVRFKQQFCRFTSKGSKVRILSTQTHPFYFKLERHCRELVKSGLLQLANYYYGFLESCLGASLPQGSGNTPVLCRYQLVRPFHEPASHSVFKYVIKRRLRSKCGLDGSLRDHLATMDEDCLGIDSAGSVSNYTPRTSGRLEKVTVPSIVLEA